MRNTDVQAEGEISKELRETMMNAGTSEELKKCWESLNLLMLEEPSLQINSHLQEACRCFLSPNSTCDVAIMEIFANPNLLKQLEATGIPKEFLLQSIRVGALMAQLDHITGASRHEAVELFVDVNGYEWANDRLKELEEKHAHDKSRKATTEVLAGKKTV